MIIPEDAEDHIYVNLFSFGAQQSQQTRVICRELNYDRLFNAPAGSKTNDRYGHDMISIADYKFEKPSFEVIVTHGADATPSRVAEPDRYFNWNYSRVCVRSEDGGDNLYNDTVVFFDLFSPINRD